MGDSSDIRGTWKQALAGKAVAALIKLLGLTCRIHKHDANNLSHQFADGKPTIWAFWHNTLIAAPLSKTRFAGSSPAYALTSASKDGAIIAAMVKQFGVLPIRGSSSRRGLAAMIAMKKRLKEGQHIFITPDGPRGPRYHFQAGAVKLAQSSGAPIVPVRFKHSASWRLKSWDKFHIPKPFSRIDIYVDEPIYVPRKLGDEAFEQQRLLVENTLRAGLDDIPEND